MKMAEGREEDMFSPTGSSPVSEDIFSAEPEVTGSVGESPYSFTSSATISIFSSDFHSEDQQIEDLLGPSLTISAAPPEKSPVSISSHPNGESAFSPSNSTARFGAPSSSSEDHYPVS